MRIENYFLDKKYSKKTFAIADENNCWDYSMLYERISLFYSVLKQHGIKKSDKVGIICENGADFFIAVMSILSVGGVVIPIEQQFPINTVKEAISQFNIKLICISGKNFDGKYDIKNSTMLNIPILAMRCEKWFNIKEEEYTPYGRETLDEADPAIIFITSGTLGKRKGVILTHSAINANIEAILHYMNPSHKDIFLITKSMIHISTLVGELLVASRAGCKVLAYNPMVSPIVQLKRVCKYKPTFVFVNPTILKLFAEVKLSNLDLSSVRYVYTSGAVIDEETIIQAEHLFEFGRVLNVYGLTEAGSRVSAQDYRDTVYKYCSVGKPLDGLEVVIKSDNGTICNPGEAGNLYVKTPSLMLGYYNDIESTVEKIHNGWLETGDVGYFDLEGYMYIICRKDDMIIRNAYNIDPYRIENVVNKLSSVSECIVFGVDDIKNRKKIVCAIRKASQNFTLDTYEIITHCLDYLAPYECPQEIIEWDIIPGTYNGKPSRKLAIEKYLKERKLSIAQLPDNNNYIL